MPEDYKTIISNKELGRWLSRKALQANQKLSILFSLFFFYINTCLQFPLGSRLNHEEIFVTFIP